MITLLAICAFGYRKTVYRNRTALFQLVYISIMAIFGTLNMASSAKIADIAYVHNRNFEGGPAEYHRLLWIFNKPIMILGSVGYVVANWMADGLLVCALELQLAPSLTITIHLRFGDFPLSTAHHRTILGSLLVPL